MKSRCDTCGKRVDGPDSVTVTFTDCQATLCWRCHNTHLAASMGLENFQHIDFEPLKLKGAGRRSHTFHFSTRLLGTGVSIHAFERRRGEPVGYRFQMMGHLQDDLMMLFGRLLERIRRTLSKQYLRKEHGRHQVIDFEVAGHIEWDVATDGQLPLVVVDGKPLDWDEFGRMLMTFEGWQFHLKILDRTEEL